MIGYDWISKWADYSSEKIAVREFETKRTLSYGELDDLTNKIIPWLKKEYNLNFGDRIAVLAENCLEYVVLFAAAQRFGFTMVPLNYRLSSRELKYMIDTCEPSLLFYEEKFSQGIESLGKETQIPVVEMNELKNTCDRFLIEKEKGVSVIQEIPEDHPIFLIFTSGSTSFPKGAMYTHKMMFWNNLNTWIRLNITSEDKALNCAPPFHTGSWNVLQNCFFHHGAYTLLMKKFDADNVLQVMEEEDHTIFWGVPTMLKMMADSQYFQNSSLEKLRYFVVGGEAMPLPLIKIWHDKGVLIRQGYGLTEVGPNVTSLDYQDAFRKAGSIGKPNFYYDVKIVNEQGKEVAPDETGEFLLKSPCVTPGYWKNMEETENTIVDGWFHTGDIVRRDKEGFIFVVDRIKNMYISGGENVYPAEIEHFIRSHPKIKEVAIVGIPDEKWGESGHAFIVIKNGEKLKKEEVVEFCQGKLGKYKIPKQFSFIDELPHNDAGKIDRKLLKKNF